MKKIITLFLCIVVTTICLSSCSDNDIEQTKSQSIEAANDGSSENMAPSTADNAQGADNNEAVEESTKMKFTVTVNDKVFYGEFNKTKAAEEFLRTLPLSVTMTELNGNEKYYILPDDLTSDDKNPGKIEKGDIMLYSGNYLVLFYDTFDTMYSYTSIGKITDTEGLKEAVGSGDVSVTFEVLE